MFTNELDAEEMEAMGIYPLLYIEIEAGISAILNLETGKYYAGERHGLIDWTDDFNHKWHPPYKYSGNVPPFNELKRLMDAGYKVTAVVIE